MEHFDLKTLGGIVVATATLIEIAKRFGLSWIKGREVILAFVLPFVFTVASKLSGNFKWDSWLELVFAVIASAVGAGLLHDTVGKAIEKPSKHGVSK